MRPKGIDEQEELLSGFLTGIVSHRKGRDKNNGSTPEWGKIGLGQMGVTFQLQSIFPMPKRSNTISAKPKCRIIHLCIPYSFSILKRWLLPLFVISRPWSISFHLMWLQKFQGGKKPHISWKKFLLSRPWLSKFGGIILLKVKTSSTLYQT